VTDNVRTLWFIGTPTDQQVEWLKAGKQMLDPGFLVIPKRITDESDAPALAFEHPNFPYLPGYAYVATASSPLSFRNALAAIYGIEYTEYLHGPTEWFNKICGLEVREIFNDD
jgi:hypothetical protein